MRIVDFSPPASPTLDQQRDALRNGLGRARMWAEAGKLDDGPLLEACLNDSRHDRQLEGPRGGWLAEILQAAGAMDRLRAPILRALDPLDDANAELLGELALAFAKAGEPEFRAALDRMVQAGPDAEGLIAGEDEILELDGESAVLRLARLRGDSLRDRAWALGDDAFIGRVRDLLGDDRMNLILRGPGDPSIADFVEGWRRSDEQSAAERAAEPPYPERMRSISAEAVVQAAEADRDDLYYRSWGSFADADAMEAVFARLLESTDRRLQARLARVFSRPGFPRFDPRLLPLCRDADPYVRNPTIHALARVDDPAVREFALAEIAGGRRVVELLAHHYRPGDERLVFESVDLPEDSDELHWLFMDVCRLLKTNPEADVLPLALVGYASTPCSFCRNDFVRLFHKRGAMPAWMAEEARFDADERTRRFDENADA